MTLYKCALINRLFKLLILLLLSIIIIIIINKIKIDIKTLLIIL